MSMTHQDTLVKIFAHLVTIALLVTIIPYYYAEGKPSGPVPGGEQVFSYQVRFDTPGYNNTYTLPVVKRGDLTSVIMEVTGQPHPVEKVYPADPDIRTGDLSTPVWRFPYGGFGQQRYLESNQTVRNLTFTKDGAITTNITFPRGSILTAWVTFRYINPHAYRYNLSLILANETLSNLTWRERFFAPFTIISPEVSTSTSLTPGDIDSDGFTDLLVSGKVGDLAVFINDRAGRFTLQKTFQLCNYDEMRDSALTDLDKNGMIDFLGGCRAVYIVYDYDNGTSGKITKSLSLNENIARLTAFDYNNDTYPDVIAATGSGKIYGYANTNGVIYAPVLFGGTNSTPVYLKMIDVDSDGLKDILTVTSSGVFALRNNHSSFDPPVNMYTHSGEVTAADIADIDHDGVDELVLGDTAGNISILKRGGGLTYVRWVNLTHPAAQRVITLDAADVDKDSFPEIISSTSGGIFHLFLNEHGGAFSHSEIGSFSPTIMDTLPADMQNDGLTDILVLGLDRHVYLSSNTLSGGTRDVNFQAQLARYLSTANFTRDPWGNEVTSIPLTVVSATPGNVTLSNLNLTYTYTAGVNITTPVRAYVSSHPANATGNVNVPLNFTSGSAGVVSVRIVVSYMRAPPYLLTLIPSTYAFPEDTTGKDLIDLERYFSDDRDDGRLTFRVSYEEDPVHLHATVSGRYMTFHPAVHWYGTRGFRVTAVDSDGLQTESNTFNVTVYHVNHPPEFRGLPSSLKVVENVTFVFDIEPYIFDVEDGTDLNVSTSDPGNITVSGKNLTMTYSGGNYTTTITLTLRDKENGTTTALMDIHVRPYGSPVFLPIPPWRTPTGVNITESTSPLDLKEYVMDADTPKDLLEFRIVSQTNTDVNVTLSGSKVCITFMKSHVPGSTIVHLRVTDGKWSDETYLQIEFMQRVVYLGGLKSSLVIEDEKWSVDLSQYFNLKNISYLSSDPRVSIQGTIASWTPREGDTGINGLRFTGFDPLNPENNDTSEGIDLTVIARNDPPVYLGGLTGQIVFEGCTWEVDLRNYFTDEETPDDLDFSVNTPNVTIKGSIATWRPNATSQTVRGVIFTATDPEGSSASSNPIDLIYIPTNTPPIAVIDEVSPTPADTRTKVHFRGHGVDPDGNITEYIWRSDKDGVLGNAPEIDVLLSPGIHRITFMVKDDRGVWSRPVSTNITVFTSRNGTESDLQKGVLIGGLVAGGVLIIAGGALLHTRGPKSRGKRGIMDARQKTR